MATTKAIRERVVAFRLTEAQYGKLKDYFDKHPVGDTRSVNTFCRKLALDVCHDRITWPNKKHAQLSHEAIERLAAIEKKNGKPSKVRAAAVAA